MSDNFDFDAGLLSELAENAPVAGGSGSFTNFGRAWIDNIQVNSWNNDQQAFVKRPFDGKPLGKGENIEFQLHQDIQEFNPALSFNKTWYVSVKESGKRSKDKTDWSEYTLPSIAAVFKGKNPLANFFNAMKESSRTYVAIDDVATGRVNKKNYDVTAPKFVAVYKSMEECKKAKIDKYGASNSDEAGIPADVVNDVKGLIEALGLAEAEKTIKDNGLYPAYTWEQLQAAANPIP